MKRPKRNRTTTHRTHTICDIWSRLDDNQEALDLSQERMKRLQALNRSMDEAAAANLKRTTLKQAVLLSPVYDHWLLLKVKSWRAGRELKRELADILWRTLRNLALLLAYMIWIPFLFFLASWLLT